MINLPQAPFKVPVRIEEGPSGSKCLVDAEHELILSSHDVSQEELEFIAFALNAHETLIESIQGRQHVN